MILAINSQNTYTQIGCVDDKGTVNHVFRIKTDVNETEFGYAAKIKDIANLLGIDLSTLDGAVLSSVVPPITKTLTKAIHLLGITDTLPVGTGIKTGLHICIDDPGTVAADLVTAAVAAKEEYALPCIVIDMGTATTVTVVNQQGKYVGGAIFPGVELSLSALADKTALLPKIEIHPPKNAISSNTVDCMKSGIVYGSAGAIDGMLDRITEELNCTLPTFIATGEYASVIIPHCRHSIITDDTLLLRGLYAIWRKNQKIKADLSHSSRIE